jgi:ribosomal protein S18 acetylase RimI-like enzyme
MRKPTKDDKPILKAWIHEMIGGIDRDKVASAEVEKYFSNQDYSLHIVDEDTKAVGFGVVRSDPFEGSDSVSELGLFAIDKTHQGKGIGTFLFQAIEAELRSSRIRKLYTKTNPANLRAINFWLSRGFEFEARLSKLNGDIDYYLLSKML